MFWGSVFNPPNKHLVMTGVGGGGPAGGRWSSACGRASPPVELDAAPVGPTAVAPVVAASASLSEWGESGESEEVVDKVGRTVRGELFAFALAAVFSAGFLFAIETTPADYIRRILTPRSQMLQDTKGDLLRSRI